MQWCCASHDLRLEYCTGCRSGNARDWLVHAFKNQWVLSMCTCSLAISIVEIYYMGMCLLQETHSSLSLAGTSVETFLSKILPMIWHHMASHGMTWHELTWMQIMRIAEENTEVSSLLRTNCTRTCVVYTIQEVSPCAKIKQMQMQMKVKGKMFGQRFHLWRSFQQAPISFHFIQWIWSSARSSLLLYQFISNWDYSTLHYRFPRRIGSRNMM